MWAYVSEIIMFRFYILYQNHSVHLLVAIPLSQY